mgnify:CR=1 FL=1
MHKEKNKFKRILWIVLTLLVLTLTGSTLYLQWYALEPVATNGERIVETS